MNKEEKVQAETFALVFSGLQELLPGLKGDLPETIEELDLKCLLDEWNRGLPIEERMVMTLAARIYDLYCRQSEWVVELVKKGEMLKASENTNCHPKAFGEESAELGPTSKTGPPSNTD